MTRRITLLLTITLVTAFSLSATVDRADAALYLVTATSGPSFGSPQEAVQVLETQIFPLFDALSKLEKDGKIMGGIPIGDRAFTFVLNAATNDEADRMVRELPAWPLFSWDVTALETFAGRAEQERAVVKAIKERSK